jgi:hypothetical protein
VKLKSEIRFCGGKGKIIIEKTSAQKTNFYPALFSFTVFS